MGTVQHWLSVLPPVVIYLIVAGVVGVESLGIPLPGEIALVSAALLIANAAGGIVWAGGTPFTIYAAGRAAEKWLSGFSWVALVLAVVAGICTTLWLRQRTRRAMRMEPDEATGSGDTATTSSRR